MPTATSMPYGHVPGIEKPISRLCQGTTMIGSGNLNYSFQLLDDALDLGVTCFDTAHIYGGGDNERTVGKWITDRGVRDRVVVLAKGAHPYGRDRVTPEDIASDIRDSQERFGFSYLDLYILHRDDPKVPVGPIVEALNEHHRRGDIGAFGGSNWSPRRLQEANDYAATHGLVPFVASSPHYSLAVMVREPWANCLSLAGPDFGPAREWYRKHNLATFSWSSLSSGFFSGRYTRTNLDEFSDYGSGLVKQCYAYEMNYRRLDRCIELGSHRGLQPAQIALGWVMQQGLNLFTLVGSHSRLELEENLAAITLSLSDAELDWLDLKSDERPF